MIYTFRILIMSKMFLEDINSKHLNKKNNSNYLCIVLYLWE